MCEGENEMAEANTRASSNQYMIVDIEYDGFVFSETRLFAGQQTNGHKHSHGELYYIVSGEGILRRDEESRTLKPRMAIFIKPDEYHQIINENEKDMVFISVWKKQG